MNGKWANDSSEEFSLELLVYLYDLYFCHFLAGFYICLSLHSPPFFCNIFVSSHSAEMMDAFLLNSFTGKKKMSINCVSWMGDKGFCWSSLQTEWEKWMN